MSAPDPLARTARVRPEHEAVRWQDGALAYGELDGCVTALAIRLVEDGAVPRLPVGGEIVADDPSGLRPRLAVISERRLHSVLLIHAGPRAGFVTALLDPGLTPPELATALRGLAPRVVVRSPGMAETVAAAMESAGLSRTLAVVDAGDAVEWALSHREPLAEGRIQHQGPSTDSGTIPAMEGGEPRYVVWTSGSSGAPRGVLLSEDAFETVHRGAAGRLDLGPEDRWITTLSPSHVGGLATVLRTASLGSCLIVRDRFDVAEVVDLMASGAVTHASLVPLMLRRILDRASPGSIGDGQGSDSLRCLLVGGAHAPPELVREAVSRGLPVALTYGMTETTSQIATASPARVREDPEGVGLPLPGTEIRIGPDDEILVRGPTLSPGYLEGGDGSEMSTPSVSELPLDANGWLATGDVGSIDLDGSLRVTGRRSDRIISGGVTVDPREVEATLRELPGVADSAVMGVPDPEWGERVAAALVLEGPHVELERIRELARERLAPAKRPRAYRVVSALPRNRSDKVDRRALSALFGTLDSDAP